MLTTKPARRRKPAPPVRPSAIHKLPWPPITICTSESPVKPNAWPDRRPSGEMRRERCQGHAAGGRSRPPHADAPELTFDALNGNPEAREILNLVTGAQRQIQDTPKHRSML